MAGKNSLFFLKIAVFAIAIAVACSALQAEQRKIIGIAQFGHHPQLDLITTSFKAEMAQQGYHDIAYEELQINFDISLISQMVTTLKAMKPELILTITTPVSQGAKNIIEGSDTIAVFAGVTDPVAAKIVPSWEMGSRNMAGASDLQDVNAVLTFSKNLLPRAKKIGIPYNPGEANDVAVLKLFQEFAPQHGLEVIAVGVDYVGDLPVRIASFDKKVDFIYVMASNLLQQAEPAIASVTNRIGMAVISANDSNVKEHLFLASFAVNYAQVGMNAARVAARVLQGEKPKTIGVLRPSYDDHAAIISAKQLQRMNITLSEALQSCDCIVQ